MMRDRLACASRMLAWNPTGSPETSGVARVSIPDASPATTRTRMRQWLNTKTWYTWLDLVLVVVMSVASLAAAWCGYQATNWNNEQSERYSQASSTRVESVRQSSIANAQLAVEVLLFNSWAEAYVRGDTALMTFYRNRMIPEVQTALDDWIATDPINNPSAPAEPFSMDGFQLSSQAAAIAMGQEAEELLNQGQDASHNASLYVVHTVMLALVLFLSGLATKFGWRPAQATAAGLSVVLLLVILARMAVSPIA